MDPTTMLEPRRIDIREVTAVTGLHDSTVRKWVREGKLTAYRVGRKLTFDAAEIAALVENSKISAPAATAPQPTPESSHDREPDAAPSADAIWLAETLSRFTPDDLRRAGEVFARIASSLDAARNTGSAA